MPRRQVYTTKTVSYRDQTHYATAPQQFCTLRKRGRLYRGKSQSRVSWCILNLTWPHRIPLLVVQTQHENSRILPNFPGLWEKITITESRASTSTSRLPNLPPDLKMAREMGHAQFNAFKPYDFKAANKEYMQKSWKKEDFVVGARSRVGIICCCDARCSPDHFFNLPENEAFVIRNGGGRTASNDVLRTIASIEILSDIKELKVIHHTDCGALAFSDEWIRANIIKNDPSMKDGPFLQESRQWADSLTYHSFQRSEGETEREVLDRSVVDDVLFLRRHPLIKPSIPITGWVFNQETGEIEEIDCGLEDGLDQAQIQVLKSQFAKLGDTASTGLVIGRTAH